MSKEELVNIKELRTVSNFAKLAGKTRQHIDKVAEDNKVNVVKVDGVKFIKLDMRSKILFKL